MISKKKLFPSLLTFSRNRYEEKRQIINSENVANDILSPKPITINSRRTFSFYRKKKRNVVIKSPASFSAGVGLDSYEVNDETRQHQVALQLPISSPRSISPSEYFFHLHGSSCCNAPLTPLSKHYDANEALLSLFSTLYEQNEFSVAYAVGVRFVETVLFHIPQHGYYGNERFKKERIKSAADAVCVTKLLGEMVDEMVPEEAGSSDSRASLKAAKGIRNVNKKEVVQQLLNSAQRSFDDAIDNEIGSKHNGGFNGCVAHIWNDFIISGPDSICTFWNNSYHPVDERPGDSRKQMESKRFVEHCRVDAEDTGDSLLPLFAQPQEKKLHNDYISVRNLQSEQEISSESFVSEQEPVRIASNVENISVLVDGQNGTEGDDRQLINSCELVDSAQKVKIQSEKIELKASSDSSSVKTGSDTLLHLNKSGVDQLDELQLALKLSMSDIISASPNIEKPNDTNGDFVSEANRDIKSLSSAYRDQFESLCESKKIYVRFIDTYQGRCPGSVNGCTVIAPLTCIQYFINEDHDALSDVDSVWKPGVHDDHIVQVIDIIAPAILPEVREKLNLSMDSFIIPSDVNDHLIEQGLLSTSQFVGVCGGNIMDDEHLGQLKSSLLLNEQERMRFTGKKIASAFFFHGHVISLLRIEKPSQDPAISGIGVTDFWVELIDSLPNPETWTTRPESQNSLTSLEPQEREQLQASLRIIEDPFNEDWERTINRVEFSRNAVRVRCSDMEHFDTLIRHYAYSKFTDAEQKFIDQNIWNDNNSHFDPRVFQAFIWAEA